MATGFSLKLGFHQPALQLELSDPNYTCKTRCSTATLPVPAAKKVECGGKMSNSTATYETRQQNQTQKLVDLLHHCAEKRSVKETGAIHGYVLKSIFSDKDLLVLLNHVAHAYSKSSDFRAAREVFDKMPQRNVFSWTVMIVGSTENGLYHDGFKYFCEMGDSGIWPDGFAYSAILQLCIGLECVDLGKMVHAHVVIKGFASHIFVSTSLLNMYMKLGEVEDSCQVFNTMTEHNEVSWNAVISGFTSNGRYLEAFNHFLAMKKEGMTPNMYTFISVLKAVGKLVDADKGKQVHECVSNLGMESNVFVGTALIDMYSKCGALSDARFIFDMNFTNYELNMPWNAMISGYSQCGCSQEAVELFVKMCENNVNSDVYTYCSVFNAIADLKHLKFVREAHGMVLKSGYDLIVSSVHNAIADAYSKCASLEDVRKVFDRMEERDVVSWTTMLTAYSQSSEREKALAVFSQMKKEGFTPNQFTFSSVFAVCASLCFLEFGRQVHALLFKDGLATDKCIESALIDMYAKCGSIIEAEKVFGSISNPDIVSWTAIISGYAQHGFVDQALKLFRMMEQFGVKPNAVTLLCILFACSHGGLVEEGLRYFRQMEETYSLVPEMEHYACIVDLLGRMGCLDEALEFIHKMPIEPNDMVWQTLLGACRVHGNVELGEIAAKKILSIRPEFSATYVLLSNTYIGTGSFRDGISLRNVMKDRGVKKEPGCSWISVNGEVHNFYARDQHHPGRDQIYLMLEDLREKIKAMGYVPDLQYVLQDGA
ncbi:Pentatricopeptide repeat-containing protein [Actinidia chinensis var. chinensis]|uniref:Pentatricopeptide repeat-containing protein n=1 Tax=Actinidia chinensis var. chinensis TaxID=1590841 RepID=A0A2R6PLN4_ACTCC|nr:Pentatricopeptide repeat-containing protein [Actinidia chinensis var. chinensis]